MREHLDGDFRPPFQSQFKRGETIYFVWLIDWTHGRDIPTFTAIDACSQSRCLSSNDFPEELELRDLLYRVLFQLYFILIINFYLEFYYVIWDMGDIILSWE